MKRYVIGVVITLVLFSSPASAQDQDVIFFRAAPLDPVAGQAGGAVAGVRFDAPVDVLMIEPFDAGEPVTGAPYSADVTTEIIQPLADGNRIERRTTSSVARDGQGRVRREQQLAAIGPILPVPNTGMTTISDPVARVHYSLDLVRKVAIPSPVFNKRIEAAAVGAAADGAGHEILHHEIRSQKMADRTEPLGTKDIEGVRAEGTRSTITIPAGAIGNVAPIDVVSERWYSPELQAVILSRRTDPRFGESTYRLENIVRAEPPPELFQVPPDFTIEAPRPFGAHVIQRAP
jgi:hypothetical protein